jgi:hypothetical protein
VRLDRAGRSRDVVKTAKSGDEDYVVTMDANYLRRYLAARDLCLVIQHRHTVWPDSYDLDRVDLKIRNDVARLEFCATESSGGTRRNFFADLLGKHIVVPFSQAGTDPDDPSAPSDSRNSSSASTPRPAIRCISGVTTARAEITCGVSTCGDSTSTSMMQVSYTSGWSQLDISDENR